MANEAFFLLRIDFLVSVVFAVIALCAGVNLFRATENSIMLLLMAL